MKLIYISGFGSTNSSKMNSISQWSAATNIEFINFQYPASYAPEKIIQKLDQLLADNQDNLIFAGCSLGGFWSIVFGECYKSPCVAINPAVKPSTTLRKYLSGSGWVKSFNGTESYELTEQMISDYKRYEKYAGKSPLTIILNLDDETLDPCIAIEILKDKGKVVTFPDGGHSGKKYMNHIIHEIEIIADINR